MNDRGHKTVKPNSQKGRQLTRLELVPGAWVPAYELRNPDGKGEILQQNARLWELKHVHGYDIENREEWIDGVCHSAYRLKPETRIRQSASRESEALQPTLFSQPDLRPDMRYPD